MHLMFKPGYSRKHVLAVMFGAATALPAMAQTNAIFAINESAAKSEITITPVRGGISVLMGSGGNIIVLDGKDGKLMVDAGIAVSQAKIEAALAKTGPGNIKYLINTHHHWDHTDGNRWVYKTGATIIAHRNTLKHDSVAVHVDDWDYTFEALPPAARPSVLVDTYKALDFEGNPVVIEHFGAGHTDSDLWVRFPKADVMAVGDVFWNGMYPYIDNQYGGGINEAISWADRVLARAGPDTIIIPGHGPVGNRASMQDFRNMLVAIRDKVAALRQAGKSVDEIIAAKPTAAFDARYGGAVISPDVFTRLVYKGL